jgi:ribose 5-phosphate isomerase B
MPNLTDSELHDIVQRVVRRTLGSSHVPVPVEVARSAQFREPDTAPATSQPLVANRIIAMGADHGGYPLKESLKAYLQQHGYQVDDCGTHSTDSVDYPDFAYAVAKKVSEGAAWRGIIIDGAGIGSCMAANKVSGVLAAMCYDHATAVNSREHNGSNVLTLGAGMIDEALARQIVITWLSTVFGGGRHGRRVDKILAIEKQ